jgi:hypothetical protein
LTIRRFSSRTTPLDQGFLADQLQGARSYRRIADVHAIDALCKYFACTPCELLAQVTDEKD